MTWQRPGRPEHTLSRGVGTKECGCRLPHLLLPAPQVGRSVQALAEPPGSRLSIPSASPGHLIAATAAPTPPTEHSPGWMELQTTPASRPGRTGQEGPEETHQGSPPESAEPRPLHITAGAVAGGGSSTTYIVYRLVFIKIGF